MIPPLAATQHLHLRKNLLILLLKYPLCQVFIHFISATAQNQEAQILAIDLAHVRKYSKAPHKVPLFTLNGSFVFDTVFIVHPQRPLVSRLKYWIDEFTGIDFLFFFPSLLDWIGLD